MSNDQENGKTARFSVKVEPSVKDRVQKVENYTGVGEATLIRHLALAMCDYYEKYGEVTLPFTVVPRNELARLKGLDERVKELEMALARSRA